MSVYDNRTESMWPQDRNPLYCQNKYILSWWTMKHDTLLAEQIKEKQWIWYSNITDEILHITPLEVIEKYKATDPLCKQYAWYNIIMNFAVSRAVKLGLTEIIRQPKAIVCPLCEIEFFEDSLPLPLVERQGLDHLDFCAPCLSRILFSTGSETMSTIEVISYLQKLSQTINQVPTQNYDQRLGDLRGIPKDERISILRMLEVRPSVKHVKLLFGSWLAALIQADILEDGTRRTSRGTQCLANDGHVCYSLGEKTLDDILYLLEIPHEKEPHYPEGNFRADFSVNGVFIEYFGLAGNPEYDEKIKLKQQLCHKNEINLISIFPKDFVNANKLRSKLLNNLKKYGIEI